MALCARNAHITVYDVTTWSWVNLVNPVRRLQYANFVLQARNIANFTPDVVAPEVHQNDRSS